MKTERVEFRPPKEFIPPESEDGKFDVVCSFESKPGGTVCLTMLGETPMPGYGKDGDYHKESKPSYAGVANQMQAAMPGGENPS